MSKYANYFCSSSRTHDTTPPTGSNEVIRAFVLPSDAILYKETFFKRFEIVIGTTELLEVVTELFFENMLARCYPLDFFEGNNL